MQIEIKEVADEAIEPLIPLLLLAEPSLRALQWSLTRMSDAVYRLTVDGEIAGAATMAWRRDDCELVELGIAESHQRRGLGRRFVAWLIDEARRRGKRRFHVGTRSTSAGNILFYQHCGLRVADVRQDYFWYYDEPIIENGLEVRDMIVFALDLTS